MAVVTLALGLIAHFTLVSLAKRTPAQLILFGAVFACWSFGFVIIGIYRLWIILVIVGVAAGIIAIGGAYRIDRRSISTHDQDSSPDA
jgi:uncharacterized membrane protein